MAIRFHYQKKIQFPHKSILKQFIIRIFEREGKQVASVDYIFCDNPYLLNINRTHLNHDYFTDIITFDLSDGITDGIRSEIYISVDMVLENAIQYKVSGVEELYRVMFHGVLHLCGYGDKTKNEKKIMREREDYYLGMFHVEQ